MSTLYLLNLPTLTFPLNFLRLKIKETVLGLQVPCAIPQPFLPSPPDKPSTPLPPPFPFPLNLLR